jgi:predicted dehydrogenase
MSQLRVGLLGAGIFAREAHLPALMSLGDRVRLTAVWSRTRASAEKLAALAGDGVAVEDSADALLARSDVDAVAIVLPIDSTAEYVERAFAAGKHVISEKPIAVNPDRARQTMEKWNATNLVWMVAENWRYESAFLQAAEIVRGGAIGRPLTATWALHLPVNAANKYFHTPWRRTGTIPGGFVVDGGVHHAAVMRLVLGEVDLRTVRANVAQLSADLPPVDTVSASFRYESGAVGSYVATYAAEVPWRCPLCVAGSEGSLRVDRGWLEVTRDGRTETTEVQAHDGVYEEVAAFIDSVTTGAPHRNTPEEALRDLELLEAIVGGL